MVTGQPALLKIILPITILASNISLLQKIHSYSIVNGTIPTFKLVFFIKVPVIFPGTRTSRTILPSGPISVLLPVLLPIPLSLSPPLKNLPRAISSSQTTAKAEFERWGDPRRVELLLGNARGKCSPGREPLASSRDRGCGMGRSASGGKTQLRAI
jgi:hypothetical protein